MIGALSQATDLPVMTAVTCPATRIHPAIIAQAAATSAVLTGGRFVLGVGTGETLNEHVTDPCWPPVPVRRAMLAEAIDVMRKLWTGKVVNHRGQCYTVDHARLYPVPDQSPDVYVSGFGPAATELAGHLRDGYVNTSPEVGAVERFRRHGGDGKPAVAGAKGCWAPTADEALRIAHRMWPTEQPGELNQVLPTPEHVEQAASLVTADMLSMPHGPDANTHAPSPRPCHACAGASPPTCAMATCRGGGYSHSRYA